MPSATGRAPACAARRSTSAGDAFEHGLRTFVRFGGDGGLGDEFAARRAQCAGDVGAAKVDTGQQAHLVTGASRNLPAGRPAGCTPLKLLWNS